MRDGVAYTSELSYVYLNKSSPSEVHKCESCMDCSYTVRRLRTVATAQLSHLRHGGYMYECNDALTCRRGPSLHAGPYIVNKEINREMMIYI